jgi:outer membrane protein assembly factor BamB
MNDQGIRTPCASLCRNARRRCTAGAVLGAFLLLGPVAWAGNWPGWRGPTGAGYSDEKDLPLTWGGKKNENVLWKVTLVGRSYSSPIVWGEQVFVTTHAKQTDKEVKAKVIPEHYVSCYAASDGKQLWRTVVPHGSWPDGYYSIATPVTDGERVYAWFGSGVAVALDFKGKILWRTERPGPYRVYPGVSSSPVLVGDTLLILVDQGKDSFLLALDRKTGARKWEKKRPPTVGGTNSSPILMKVKGKTQVLVAAGKALQGLDPATGDVLWWCDKDGGYWTSLTHGSGLVYADSGGGRGRAVDPTGSGNVNKSHVKWEHKKVPEGLGCPLIVGDYLYRVHKPDVLKCWKLSTGELAGDKRLAGISIVSSPIATADGRIYLASARKSYVLKAGPKLEVLAVNTLPAGDDGPSPAFSGGRIFVKDSHTLFGIGTK